MVPTQRGLAIWQAILTTYMTVTAGAGLADLIGQRAAGFMALVAAALNAGTTAYVAAVRPAPQSASSGPGTGP